MITRRHFLKSTTAGIGCGLAMPALLSAAQTLTSRKEATDFRALVCIFQYGGNDGFNTFVPLDGSPRTSYAAERGGTLSLPLSHLDILPLGPADDGALYGLNRGAADGQPSRTAALQQLFSQGRAAVVSNVGALVEPVTASALQQGAVILPPQLYSHNDQQTYWQACHQATSTGWLGRAMHELAVPGAAGKPCSYSTAGEAVLLRTASDLAQPYIINPHPRGAEKLTFLEAPEAGSAARRAAFEQMIAAGAQSNALERAYADTMRRTLSVYSGINGAIALSPSVESLETAFPATALGAQLKMIAQLIAARTSLGHARMTFYAMQGGYDTHDNQLEDHANLLAELSDAIGSFYGALDALGVGQDVVTFTASEFGRTLTSNGDGSDHGWGSHHMVIGGGVIPGFHGEMPDLADPELDAGWGQIIPTTSIEQYASPLLRWFGVPEARLPDLLPNLPNFQGDIGLFA